MPTARAGFTDGPGIPGRNALIRFGPTLQVRIGFDVNFQAIQTTPPNLPNQTYPALIDTGASDTCIDSALAIELGLPILDRQVVSGVSGAFETTVYAGRIYIPDLSITIYGRLLGVHLQAGGQTHFALLGRAFLRDFGMLYDGRTGQVTLSND